VEPDGENGFLRGDLGTFAQAQSESSNNDRSVRSERTLPPQKFKIGHVWSCLVTFGHFGLVQRGLSFLVAVRKDLGGFDSGSVSICVYLWLKLKTGKETVKVR
jgi:hypothetical protein